MLVSTSFLSSSNIPKDLEKLNKTSTDYIHVDVMDGKFVDSKTMPFSEMKKIYKYTDKRLDVHLMVENPTEYIKNYAELNTEFITIHIELDDNLIEYINLIKSYGIKVGLAINPNTQIKEIVPYLKMIDLILIMSVEPGKGGQEFITETKKKIEETKVLLNSYNYNCLIEVDGGINNNTKQNCLDADILVSGSYIVKSENFEERIKSLK